MTDTVGDSVPINFGNPGCPAMVRRTSGQWAPCLGDPTHVALADPRPLVRVFPCRAHLELPHLRDVAPMTDRDRAELDGRIVQHYRAIAGLRHIPIGPAEPDPD